MQVPSGTARPRRDVLGACQVLLSLEPHVAWDADRHPERVQCEQHLARRGAEVVSEGQGLHDRDKQSATGHSGNKAQNTV